MENYPCVLRNETDFNKSKCFLKITRSFGNSHARKTSARTTRSATLRNRESVLANKLKIQTFEEQNPLEILVMQNVMTVLFRKEFEFLPTECLRDVCCSNKFFKILAHFNSSQAAYLRLRLRANFMRSSSCCWFFRLVFLRIGNNSRTHFVSYIIPLLDGSEKILYLQRSEFGVNIYLLVTWAKSPMAKRKWV